MVVEQMKDIRTAQFAYKAIHGTYANDFDQLMIFLIQGKIPTPILPSKSSTKQLKENRKTIKNTLEIETFKDVFKDKPSIDIKRLPYIPFSENQKFTMFASVLEKEDKKVPVFKLIAPKKIYLSGIDTELNNEKSVINSFLNWILYNNLEKQFENDPNYNDLILGSLEDASTSGNWENN
jgi:hypothetical protein